MFRGIRKLPPATLLIVEKAAASKSGGTGACRRHRQHAVRERSGSSACAHGIEESVRMQMVSDVPIGAFLSGRGRLERRRRVHVARTAIAQSRPTQSGSGAARPRSITTSCLMHAASPQLFRTDHHEIVVRPDVVSLLPRLLWHMDEPIADTAFITTYLVSEFARQATSP